MSHLISWVGLLVLGVPQSAQASTHSFVSSHPATENVVLEIHNSTASFHYRYAGQRHTYESMDGDRVQAVPRTGGWDLFLDGSPIGSVSGNGFELCQEPWPCSAAFYHHLPESAAKQLHDRGGRFSMDIAPTPEKRWGGPFTLEPYAQNQIHQYGTATCAFNAGTGIYEILYAMHTGERRNFSEPYFLVYAPKWTGYSSLWNWYGRMNKEMTGMVPESAMPVSEFYRPRTTFYQVEDRARDYFQKKKALTEPIPFAMRADKLFFHAKTLKGKLRVTGRASEKEFDQMVDWFQKHHMPVNLHHLINGYWHSVILLGYDPESESLLIKDSLGNTKVRGTWKSRQWFLKNAYGAIGVELDPAS